MKTKSIFLATISLLSASAYAAQFKTTTDVILNKVECHDFDREPGQGDPGAPVEYVPAGFSMNVDFKGDGGGQLYFYKTGSAQAFARKVKVGKALCGELKKIAQTGETIDVLRDENQNVVGFAQRGSKSRVYIALELLK